MDRGWIGWMDGCRGGPKGKYKPKNFNKGDIKVGENGGCGGH